MVLGLSQVFLQPNLPTDVAELGNHIFETIILVLSVKNTDLAQPRGKLDKLLDKLMDNEVDDLTDTEIMVKGTKLLFSDNNFTDSTEETEASIIVTQLISPLSDYDEIAYFKNLLNDLHQRKPNATKATVSALSPERRQDLMSIVMSQKVKLNESSGDNTVIRKIVKAKHK